MKHVVEKTFDIMGDNLVELSTENELLENKLSFYDEKWLQQSKCKLLRQVDDKKKANLIMSRMQKQMIKQN